MTCVLKAATVARLSPLFYCFLRGTEQHLDPLVACIPPVREHGAGSEKRAAQCLK